MNQKPIPIYVVHEGGVIHNVIGVPPGVEIVLVNQDVEGADPEEVSASPLDGEPCCIQYFGETAEEGKPPG